ncbi:MAG: LemA family protein, partial [Alphaproteobacteria bacterium]|nr:LemA family protein [Alphaproteobacteria bacterium]
SAAMSAKGVAGKNAEEGALSGALKSLFALSESYPDLKANTNFLELQQELSDTETKIQAARQFYNTVVQSMNIKVKSFPSNIVAGMFHFGEEKYFELDEAEREAVKHAPSVKF